MVAYGNTYFVTRYLDSRDARMVERSPTLTVLENTSRQNQRSNHLKPSSGPFSKRIEGIISRRYLEQNRRQASEERSQPRTHVIAELESLTALTN